MEQYKNRPFALIGVNSDEDREKTRGVVAEKDLNWRSFWNGPEGTRGPISTRWNIQGWPMSYVIDEHGTIRHRRVFGDALDEVLAELVAAAEK